MLHLAGKAPIRRRPVNSALGGMSDFEASSSSVSAVRGMLGACSALGQQAGAAAGLGVASACPAGVGCVLEGTAALRSVRPRRPARAPRRVPLRSRPSAFAGPHRGHWFCHLRLRCSAASSGAHWPGSRPVLNLHLALGSAACQGRCRWSRLAWSAPLAGPGQAGALNTSNAA